MAQDIEERRRERERPFRLLGLSLPCTVTEVRQAYRKLALQYHPDRNKDGSPAAEVAARMAFEQITRAYEQCVERLAASSEKKDMPR
jgi:DnaJ family protein C protein 7